MTDNELKLAWDKNPVGVIVAGCVVFGASTLIAMAINEVKERAEHRERIKMKIKN